ncbi:hypothetical protein GXM_03711 [Nostoc sphaeroides CCNUC1]|uniref:Uncharacterized protein n=1 Tax=Nostoc sphaeroides CCNUC1 TaxID=2653204 RepID=A0A5P8W0V3_9NOSO|nr:hypothetical protein GXM_03711 [Nostoc sphaeroides CCNUC1]
MTQYSDIDGLPSAVLTVSLGMPSSLSALKLKLSLSPSPLPHPQ